MKMKWKVVLAVSLVAVGSQAAVINWGVSTLSDNGGPLDDGGGYALPGVDLFLVYNGVNGVAMDVQWNGSELQHLGTENAARVIAQYTTTSDDYNNLGGFGPLIIENVGQDWLGDVSPTWEAMNDRSFSIIAISDADDVYVQGETKYGIYTAKVSNFSTASGANGTGFLVALTADASANGNLTVIPEPATLGLMGVAGLGMFLARKKARA